MIKAAIQKFAGRCLLATALLAAIASLPQSVALASNQEGASFEDGAVEFVQNMSADAIALMANKDLNAEEQSLGFRKLLDHYFDLTTIGKWVLGRHWRRANEDQRVEFLKVFEDLMVRTYVERFKDYKGEKLHIQKAIRVGDRDALVEALLVSPSDQIDPVKVDWRLRANSGHYKVIDVMIAGVSLGQTQRSEFASVIRKNGGEVESLLVQLRKE